jgi:hypothetical protein
LIAPRSWSDFQHYKDRSPPWIKLHKGLLDNFEYQCLPVASRALAPMLWLLASESDKGEIDATPKKLAFRLRMTEREVADALKPLIDNAFFVVVQDDSDPLAEAERLARLETEAEKRREEAEKKARDFEAFWTAYPKKEGKKDAQAAWNGVDAPVSVIVAAVAEKRKCEDWQKERGKYIPLPATYLRGKRWEDEATAAGVTVPTNPAAIYKPEPELTEAQLAANRERMAREFAKLNLKQGAH